MPETPSRPSHSSEVRLRLVNPNVCTCGAHPGAACECDSSYCTGGAAWVAEDGRPFYGGVEENLAENRRYAGWERGS